MKKIKVMNLIWSMGDGGAQQIVLNYLRAFHEDPDIDFRLYVYTEPTNSKYDQEIKEKNYNVVYLNYPKTRIQIPYIKRFFQKPVSKKHWEKAIHAFRPDIVHVHISELLELTMPGIVHENVPVRFDTLHSSPYRNKGKIRRIISDSFQNQNVIPICLTEEQVQTAKEWYGIRDYEIVRNGIDIDAIKKACCSREKARCQFGLEMNSFVVIGIGRLHPIKNFQLLIEAFAEITRKNENAVLVLAGEGKEKEKLIQHAKILKISEKVQFLGNIPNVAELCCAADVLGVTSISESVSLVALEAQVCGLRCVISSGVPDESIVCDNIRKMSPCASSKEWAEALMDTEFRGSPVQSLNSYDVHNVNQKMKEVYLKRCSQKMDNKNDDLQ